MKVKLKLSLVIRAQGPMFFKLTLFFYSNNFDFCDSPLGALLKQEVVLNKTFLFWGNEVAARWLFLILL